MRWLPLVLAVTYVLSWLGLRERPSTPREATSPAAERAPRVIAWSALPARERPAVSVPDGWAIADGVRAPARRAASRRVRTRSS